MSGRWLMASAWTRLGPAGPVFVARLLALVASVVTAVIVARALGPEGRGVVATFVILQLLASVTAGFGTGAAAYVTVGRQTSHPSAIAGALLVWSVVVMLVAASEAGLLAVVGLLNSFGLDRTLEVSLLLTVGSAGLYLATALTQLGMGLSRTAYVAVGFCAAPLLTVAFTTVVAAMKGDTYAFVGAQVAGWSAAALLLIATLGLRPRLKSEAIVSLVRTGRAAALGDLSNALAYRFDTLILNLMAGASAAGIYSLAVQVMEPIWVVATATTGGLLIQYRRAGAGAWRGMTVRSARAVALLTLAGSLSVVILMPVLVAAVVGPSFSGSIVASAVLLPGIVFVSASKVLAAYQVASARLWLSTGIATASLVITTALDLALIPVWGAAGASAASSVGYGASLALWIMAFRRFGTPG